VQRGTGTAAQIFGYSIGGKTGTGETGVPGSNTTWFIAFGGDEDAPPRVAVAVVLQNQSGTGGSTAAPIAREVMQAILQGTENP
jgi:peptidoglycan glycosyltransferase